MLLYVQVFIFRIGLVLVIDAMMLLGCSHDWVGICMGGNLAVQLFQLQMATIVSPIIWLHLCMMGGNDDMSSMQDDLCVKSDFKALCQPSG